MPLRPPVVLSTVVCAFVLVLGVDSVTHAATGSSLILGRTNFADRITTVSTSTGPALELRPGASADAPLKVTGTGKVWNLNADRLDSLDSADLQRRITTICPPGRAMVGAAASGAPTCGGIEPATLVARVSDPGTVDTPIGFTTAGVAAGRYRLELSASLIPSVAGTPAAPKSATCAVKEADDRVLLAEGSDTGNGARLSSSSLVMLTGDAGGLDLVCGFPRGSWRFEAGSTPVLTLTPVPAAESVPVRIDGERSATDLS
jgi:hypothetical protein